MTSVKRIDNLDILLSRHPADGRLLPRVLGLPFLLPYAAEEEWAAIEAGNLTIYLFKSEAGEHAHPADGGEPGERSGIRFVRFEIDDLDEAIGSLDGRVEWASDEIITGASIGDVVPLPAVLRPGGKHALRHRASQACAGRSGIVPASKAASPW